MKSTIIVAVIIIILILIEVFCVIKGHKATLHNQTIEKQKYLNAYLENATVFEKGKRYRLVGGKDVEFHVYDDNNIVLKFTSDDVIITRIGCIANFDTSTRKFTDKSQNAH